MAGRLILALASLACLPLAAGAQSLADPTRPPGGGAEAKAVASTTPAESAEGLSAIVRRPGRRAAALINGELVELGGVVSGTKLVRIGEDSVVLEGPNGRETLMLTPGIAKIVAKPGKRATGDAAGTKTTK